MAEENVVREAIFRLIPSKAHHLTAIANTMEEARKSSRIGSDEFERILADFIAVHEDISHALRVLNRLHELGLE